MTTIQSSQTEARVGGAGAAMGPTELEVAGMTCSHCAARVTEAIQGVRGVRSAAVNVETRQAQVRWAPGARPDAPALVRAVEAAGFKAKVAADRAPAAGEGKLAGWQFTLWVGVLGTAPLMAGEWFLGLGMSRWFSWVSFGLAGLVQVLAGARFYRGAWNQMKAGHSNMDTLVALGSTTAFGYSAWALLSGQGGHYYFMEAASIITLISAGHWMESRVAARASSALRRLLNLAPAMARRQDVNGGETEVRVADLRVGDVVNLRPGDHVPADGVILEGGSAVDESMLTGEATPVDKVAGNRVYAGTINVNGRLRVEVSATGEETALAHIIEAVQRAQTSRAAIQRLGDRISSLFVPAVTGVALASGLWWGFGYGSASHAHAWLARFIWSAQLPPGAGAAGFIIAAAVLIIACPCAMGLATPAAIMAGSNAAAQRGILVRDGVALEKAGRVSMVLFDKTGTLTAGKPELAASIEPGSPRRRQDIKRVTEESGAGKTGSEGGMAATRLAAALAEHSTHPISQTIARLPHDGIKVTAWEEVRGAGVMGRISEDNECEENIAMGDAGERRVAGRGGEEGEDKKPLESGWELRRPGSEDPQGQHQPAGQMARLGSLAWVRESGVDLAAGAGFIEEWSKQGASILGLAVDGSLRGLFAIKDTLKPGAADVVRQLRRQGMRVGLVTGDNKLAAASIGRQVGIDPELVFSEVKPVEKAALVERLQGEGERVAFVGDGINDAPALEQADLGIAVSRASDVAREAADIILLRSEIEAVPEGLGLARATLRTIKQNLFWAFFYNAVGIPLAALGFMSPILCAAAMGLSDLVVIGNALRLIRWRR